MVINEAAEIAELHRLYELQRQACLDHPYPSYEERIENLGKLKGLVLDYQEKFIEAMSDDFGHRSRGDSGIADLLITIQGIDYCVKRLKEWMKPSKRHVALPYRPAENYLMYQPVGVFGLPLLIVLPCQQNSGLIY